MVNGQPAVVERKMGSLRIRTLAGVAAAVAAMACHDRARPRPADPWVVGREPITSIRGDSVEFAGIDGVERLSNGSVVVANTGASKVLVFDSRGRLTMATGAKGSGPGDFRGTLRLVAGSGDSTLVYDTALLRWSVLAPGGQFVRPLPQGAEPSLPTWLYRGAMVANSATRPVGRWAIAVVDRVRATDPDYRHLIEARIDRAGLLWIADSGNASRWQVFTDSVGPGHPVTLPAGAEWVSAGPGYVVLVVRDSLDLERVEVRSLVGVRDVDASPGASASVGLDTTLVARRLTALFPRLMMAQELFYSNHGRYSAAADSLEFRLDGAGRLLISGDSKRWLGVLVDPPSGVTCAVSVGFASPAGWSDGTPFCSSVRGLETAR